MPTATKRKKGRPSMTYLTEEKEERVTRSLSVPCKICLISQEIGGLIHKVETK